MFGLASQTKIRKVVVHADVDVDKSFGLRGGVFRWSRERANWPHPLHPKFICHGLASWDDGSEIEGWQVLHQFPSP